MSDTQSNFTNRYSTLEPFGDQLIGDVYKSRYTVSTRSQIEGIFTGNISSPELMNHFRSKFFYFFFRQNKQTKKKDLLAFSVEVHIFY